MDPSDQPQTPPPPADPAPPPPADLPPTGAGAEAAPPARKPPSQGFLDSQRAMSLKWAIKRGTRKDGTPVTDEDKSWYAKWEADHPAKPAAARPPLGVVDGEDAEPIKVTGPTPSAKAPPRVDPDPPRESGGKAKAGKADWRAKYRQGLKVDKLAGIKVTDTDGKPLELDPRELICVATAGVVCGLLKSCEDALALVGAKPYFNVSTDMLAGAIVLMADQQLPARLEVKPEHLVAFGCAAIVAPRIVHYKKIKEAQGKATDAKAQDARREEMRKRTRDAEAVHAAKQAAQPSSPPPASPPMEVVEVKGGEAFRNPSEEASKQAREGFDLERDWKPDPSSTLIV